MSRTSLFLLFIFLVAFSPYILAQNNGGGGGFNYGNELAQRAGTPQSPEAAAFGRYGDVAVNMYSGTPNIQVPIYTHKGREFDLSMGLTYDASGIRVQQLPTPVGLGWNFDVGGRISRVVNGLADDYFSANSIASYKSWYDSAVRSGMLTYSDIEYSFGNATGGSKIYQTDIEAKNYLEFLDKIHKQEYDTQPDMYMVNAPGLNETFVFDLNTKTPYPLYNPNTKIEVLSGNLILTNAGGVTTFKVTTDNGTQYFFDAVEQTESTKDNDTESHYQNSARVHFTSSWYLTKIISPLGKDTYEFEYVPYTDYRNDGIINVMTEKTTIITGPPEDNTSQYSRANTSTRFFNRQVINKIVHNDKVIVEVDVTPQFDGGPDVAVTGITTFSDGTTTTGLNRMKHYQLDYSYFKTNSSVPINASQELNLRLKLDAVTIKDAYLQEVYDYTFEYINPFSIASLSSLGQDYLGYYNGANNNSSLIPSSPVNSQAGENAFRGVNFTFAKNGLLNKMTYPTGGHTIFDYEQATLRYPNGEFETHLIERINVTHSPSSLPSVDPNQCNLENAISNVEITPNVATSSFEVGNGQDGIHYVTYTKSGTANNPFLSTLPKQAILIKKENPSMTYTWSDIFDSNCNILINPSSLIWEATHDTGTQNVSFSLDQGHYQVLIPIYDTGYSKTLIIEGPNPVYVVEYIEEAKAGIRIKTIKDYKDATTLVKQKEYTYNGSSQISNPIFEYITNEKRHPDPNLSDPTPAPEDYELLHVMAQPINGDIEYIVYNSVTESIVDISNPSNTLSKSYSFNTPNAAQGVYSKGNYQLQVPGTGGYFSSSHYSKLPSFGSVKRESTPATQKESQFENPRLHYQTFGLAVVPIGANSVLYPTVVPNPNSNQDGWKIIMAPAKFLTTIEGPPTPTFPDECNGEENCRPEIARLKLHKTNIYGYHGGEVLQTTTIVDQVTTSMSYTYTEGDMRYPKTMTTSTTSTPAQKTVYTYPFEVFEASSNDPNDECYTTLPDGTVINLCDQSNGGNYVYSQLINTNMLNQPVIIQQYDGEGSNETQASTAITSYYSHRQPQQILTAKANDDLESRMTFEQYDNGNLVQARQENGTVISFIWGYNNRYVIAKISNITYDELPPNLVADIKTYSNSGNQSALLNSLQSLQNDSALVNSLMTYYTYIPNIGVTTMTDETGYRMQYFYDNFQRLERVEDQEGNILSENEYNYKN